MPWSLFYHQGFFAMWDNTFPSCLNLHKLGFLLHQQHMPSESSIARYNLGSEFSGRKCCQSIFPKGTYFLVAEKTIRVIYPMTLGQGVRVLVGSCVCERHAVLDHMVRWASQMIGGPLKHKERTSLGTPTISWRYSWDETDGKSQAAVGLYRSSGWGRDSELSIHVMRESRRIWRFAA